MKDHLDAYGISIWEKASFYHFIHAVGLLVVGLLKESWPGKEKILDRTGTLLLVGITLFSGSLYLLAVTNLKWLGAITPLGGTAFIVAWLYLTVVTLKLGNKSDTE